MSEEKLVPIRARIRNFQSIEDLEIEVKGFTCLAGPTNIGKSAITRALAFSALNKPVGGLVRSGAKFCSVEVSSAAGWSYLWEKGGGVNRYTIGGKTYDKVGQAQLPEIASLGFTSVELGKSELHPWWASQFDPVFLLDQPGAAVTDFISKVSRLSVMQDAIVLSARGKKSSADAAKGSAERAAEARAKLAKLAAVDGMVTLRDELVEQAKSIRTYEAGLAALRSASSRLTRLTGSIEAMRPASGVRVPTASVGAAVGEISSLHRHWRRLEDLAKGIIALRRVQSVSVPATVEGVSDLARISRFRGVPAATAAVHSLRRAEAVTIPSAPFTDAGLAKFRSACQAAARIVRLKASVDSIRTEVSVPGRPEGVEELKACVNLSERAGQHLRESGLLEKQLDAVGIKLAAVEARIASIPRCAACGRPSAASHRH